MKKNLITVGLLAGTLALSHAVVYADTTENTAIVQESVTVEEEKFDYYDVKLSIADEEDTAIQTYSAAVEEDVVHENPLKAYATESDHFIEYEGKGSNGQVYKLVFNTEYSYTDSSNSNKIYATGAQLTNISQDSKSVVTDIVIPDSVVTTDGTVVPVISIGEVAFDSCYATEITVPASVYEIQDRAFTSCSNLKTVNVNGDITASPSYVYSNKYYIIPTKIGDGVFEGCKSLTKANIDGFQTIGKNLFYGCVSLTEANILFSETYTVKPATGEQTTTKVTATIGDSAFYCCNSLEYVKINDNIKSVGNTTFNGCTSLKKLDVGVTLASGLTYEDFADCTALSEICVDENNSNYAGVDGILYNKKITTLYYYPLNKQDAVFNLPETVTSISTYAAAGHSYLQELNITGEVTLTINASAFNGCTALKKITNAYNMGSTISKQAFANCTALTSIDLYGWAKINERAFENCTALKEITADLGVGTIGNYCFAGCTALESADLKLLGYAVYKASEDSSTFGTYVFDGCTSLKTCDLPELLLGISTGTFNECTALETVTSGDYVATIESLAFNNCTSLVNAPSPRFLVNIKKNAFVNCTSLKDYMLTRSVMIINDNAFVDCTKLSFDAPQNSYAHLYAEANNIPVGFIEDDIQDYEFLVYGYNKTNKRDEIVGYRGGFTSLVIPDASQLPTTYLGANWITKPEGGSDCSMKKYLTYIDFGGVTEIGATAFSGVTGLETAILNPGLTTIGASAFNGCTSLRTIALPSTLHDYYNETTEKTVVAIGESAFKGCTALESITANVTEEITASTETATFSKSAFSGCTNLSSIEFCDNVAEIGESCFLNNKALTTLELPLYCKTVGKSAFSGCTALEHIEFNPHLEKIGETSFLNCTSLKYLTLDNAMLVQTEAFKGCTSLERVIIYANANVAISNNPFVDNTSLTIVAVDASKAQTYVDYKNSLANTSFTIELAEFVEVSSKARVKCTISAPENVNVYKLAEDGTYTLLDTANSYVVYNDQLKFEITNGITEDFAFYVNGSICNGNTYTVEETITHIEITADEVDKFELGDIDADGSISAADAAIALQYTLNTSAITLDEKAFERADVNKDGTISAADSAAILQKTLKSTFEF